MNCVEAEKNSNFAELRKTISTYHCCRCKSQCFTVNPPVASSLKDTSSPHASQPTRPSWYSFLGGCASIALPAFAASAGASPPESSAAWSALRFCGTLRRKIVCVCATTVFGQQGGHLQWFGVHGARDRICRIYSGSTYELLRTSTRVQMGCVRTLAISVGLTRGTGI